MEITNEDKVDILYVSSETEANVAYVNTHAQLEAMRDDALSSTTGGPRVLLAGPADCGKSSLARVLTAYAVKLGRCPLFVDLDASQSMVSVPGTMAAIPVSSDSINADRYCTSSVMSGGDNSTQMPLVFWYGSQDLLSYPDLYKAQLTTMGNKVSDRLTNDSEAGASGVIVNAPGWIEDLGYEYLLHAIESFQINVVLVLGHDRLYSMLGSHFKKKETGGPAPKLIKLPRNGGAVSRDASFRTASRSECIKQYFYGNAKRNNLTTPTPQQYQFSPSLLEVPLGSVHLYQFSSVSLSSSLLPISAKQSTDPIQLTKIATSQITAKFQRSILAVCHPSAVRKYEESGSARELYLAGVAGFVVVEKVDVEKSSLSLLSPCAGSLPSCHLLVGDIVWVE